MIIVTGGAGFVGSNLVRALNARGRRDVTVVDDLTDARKVKNLAACEVADYLDKDDFAAMVDRRDARLRRAEAIFHQGACADTMEPDERYVMRNNYEYSRRVLDACVELGVPLIYASSAAVYGLGSGFREERACEGPLNVYGHSKLLFDERVRAVLPATKVPVVGLRYFNVYGPGEAHKGPMASVAFQLDGQLRAGGKVRLFRGEDGADGEQRRDFVHVDDVVRVNLWFYDHPAQGIFNVGTGASRSFNDVARAVIGFHGRGEIEYIPFPEALRGKYQAHTEADLGRLRAAGYQEPFRNVEEGVPDYLALISHDNG